MSKEEENKELHDKAWNLLEEKGLSLGERIKVRAAFVDWSGYREEYPFIVANTKKRFNKDEFQYYHSEIKAIKNYNFLNRNEVILANAIYENVKEDFNPNVFIQQLKFTFRILGVKSAWAD